MPNFKAFDGTSATPRPVQTDTLNKLNEEWNKAEAFALVLPTGSGKSKIARSLQIAVGADVLTPSNVLVAQYQADYPNTNFLKGKTHYQCKSGLDCKTWSELMGQGCANCPYIQCKQSVMDGEPSFFNPMSYYYAWLNPQEGAKASKTLVVDEADMLPSMVLMLCGKRLKRSDFKFSDKCINEIYLVDWLKQQIDRLDRLSQLYQKQGDMEKVSKCRSEIDSLALIKGGLDEDPQNYVIWIDKDGKETYLNIRPLFPPRFLMNRIVGGKKLILMSGTLFEHDIKAIVGDRYYQHIEQPSPIPVENRRIYYKPAPFKINWQTDPKQLVEYIESFVKADSGNTLIHVPYSLSKKLVPHFKQPIIFNTSEDKEEKIDEFKRNGGIFLASGCAEGVDFKGDYCRLNLIPKMPFPDLSDPAVQKRKSLQDGENWYAITTMRTVIQMAGRSTRGMDDFSKTVIMDPNFGRTFQKIKGKLPKYFSEALTFG